MSALVTIEDALVEQAYNDNLARWTSTDEDGNEVVMEFAAVQDTLRADLQLEEAKLLVADLIDGQFLALFVKQWKTKGKPPKLI